jgi:hypothetical protein
MNSHLRILTAIAFMLVLIAGIIGCTRDDETSEPGENPVAADTSDEESAVQLTLTDTYDHVRNGAHLIMSHDEATNSFKGTVKNTTGAILPQVRVEVHLSNGVELGPTPSIDLAPDETRPIVLQAMGPPFDRWTAHPEVGPSTGSGGEGGAEGGGEHGQGGEGAEGGGN